MAEVVSLEIDGEDVVRNVISLLKDRFGFVCEKEGEREKHLVLRCRGEEKFSAKTVAEAVAEAWPLGGAVRKSGGIFILYLNTFLP